MPSNIKNDPFMDLLLGCCHEHEIEGGNLHHHYQHHNHSHNHDHNHSSPHNHEHDHAHGHANNLTKSSPNLLELPSHNHERSSSFKKNFENKDLQEVEKKSDHYHGSAACDGSKDSQNNPNDKFNFDLHPKESDFNLDEKLNLNDDYKNNDYWSLPENV